MTPEEIRDAYYDRVDMDERILFVLVLALSGALALFALLDETFIPAFAWWMIRR